MSKKIIIADSGSTKTTWVLIDSDGQRKNYHTIGLNPFFVDENRVVEELKLGFGQSIMDDIDEVYFYGSGCSSKKNNEIIQRGLERFYIGATLEIHHDLLAAARALCGRDAGIACILGTGSNTCYYDGNDIVKNVRALGFILGDEGSAGYIGKRFIQDLLNEELPEDVIALYKQTYDYTPSDILDRVYKHALPNRFLAQFAGLAGSNLHIPYFEELVRCSFEDFADKHLEKYEQSHELPISFVGSVAYNNKDLLEEVLEDRGMRLGIVIKEPIDRLIEYHL